MVYGEMGVKLEFIQKYVTDGHRYQWKITDDFFLHLTIE